MLAVLLLVGCTLVQARPPSGRIAQKPQEIHAYIRTFPAVFYNFFHVQTAELLLYILAISISVSFLISVFSRLVISASAVSMAVSTFTPVSIAFLRMTKPSFECSAP